jgi:hypothetical protein
VPLPPAARQRLGQPRPWQRPAAKRASALPGIARSSVYPRSDRVFAFRWAEAGWHGDYVACDLDHSLFGKEGERDFSVAGPHLGSSPDAIPSCKVIDHRADSRCVVRSLPNPEPQKCQSPPVRGRAMNIRRLDRDAVYRRYTVSPTQAPFASPFLALFLPWGCSCPRLTSRGLGAAKEHPSYAQ